MVEERGVGGWVGGDGVNKACGCSHWVITRSTTSQVRIQIGVILLCS